MLVTVYTVLGLPLSSSVVDVVVISWLYIVLSLSMGLLVSAIATTQLTALIVSAVLFMLPVIMLSGMIFPIDNMPVVLQWLSCVIPARWYIEGDAQADDPAARYSVMWQQEHRDTPVDDGSVARTCR